MNPTPGSKKAYLGQVSAMGNPLTFSVRAWIFDVWFIVDFERKDAGDAHFQFFLTSDLPPWEAGNP